MSYKKALNILACFLSAAAYTLSLVNENFLWFIIGIPFFLNFIIFIHECGHAIFGLINKNEITELKIPLVTITANSVKINETPNFHSYCSFAKKPQNALLYAGGLISSLVLLLIMVALWRLLENNVLLLCAIISGLHFAKNMLPLGESDFNMVLFEIIKRGKSKI